MYCVLPVVVCVAVSTHWHYGSCGAPVCATLRSLSLPPCLRLLGVCAFVRLEGGAEAEAPSRLGAVPDLLLFSLYICTYALAVS